MESLDYSQKSAKSFQRNIIHSYTKRSQPLCLCGVWPCMMGQISYTNHTLSYIAPHSPYINKRNGVRASLLNCPKSVRQFGQWLPTACSSSAHGLEPSRTKPWTITNKAFSYLRHRQLFIQKYCLLRNILTKWGVLCMIM